MSNDSEPSQHENSTESHDDERSYYQEALELCRHLLSTGYSESVADLSSRCSHLEAFPNPVEKLCSIPNSPISLTGDGLFVTLSCVFLSAPATFACILGVPENDLVKQITRFMDSVSRKSKLNDLGRIRENDELVELELMPLLKRPRKDVNHYSVMTLRANDIIANPSCSMLETLKAVESQASLLMLSTHDQEKGAFEHNARSGPSPRTRIFGCDIFCNVTGDVDPMHCLEQSKQNSPSPPEAGYCNQLEIGDFQISDFQIADNQILIKDKEEDNNEINLFPKEEVQAPYMQLDSAAPLTPSGNGLVVEDTEDRLVLSCDPSKPEEHAVHMFNTPVIEMPLKPCASTANQDRSLVQKTQDLSKSSGKSKVFSCSPEKKYTGRSKATQKSKKNFNSVQPKDHKEDMSLSSRDQSKHNTFPHFDSYTIVEEEGSGGYGIVYKAKRKTDGKEFAIKCPHAGAQKHYIHNEIKMLERFGGKNFIIKYEGCLINEDSECIILEHQEHDRPDLLKREIDMYQLRLYGYCMFKALSSLHKQGVVHRDVKPGNFLFSRKTNKGYLIDFNLAVDLDQKYRRAGKSKAASDFPTASKKRPSLVKSPDTTNRVTNKSSQTTALAPNSLKKAPGKRRDHDINRWERLKSHGAEGSGLTSTKDVTSTMNNRSDKRREPLPCHGRKQLLNFLQETMSGQIPNHEELSKASPTSMRKRVAAFPEKAEKELPYMTPMPLHTNGRPETGDVNQKKGGPCSGTKGFRAPEVCLRSFHQGTKIDVWSAGVTLLFLMMGRTPFTGDPEQNIKEIAELRGSEELWEVAKLHNRESSFPQELYETRYVKGMELRKWCELNTKRSEFLDEIPRSLLDLVDKCLTVNPRVRISAEDALKHEFFRPIHESLRKQRQRQMVSQLSEIDDTGVTNVI